MWEKLQLPFLWWWKRPFLFLLYNVDPVYCRSCIESIKLTVQIKQCSQFTLTGHFIRYTLLVLGWTPFRTLILHGIDSTRCCKHSSEILVHIDTIASHSCCRFVGCTSMMWISRSTTSQRCSIGLRSGDCGGHLSKVNSLSCSRNQSEMIWATVELLLSFYHLYPVCPFSSDLWHQQGIFIHTTAAHWIFLFFGPFSVNPRDGCVWKSQ